ncbi:5' DNA nuclease [Peteryoungia ipomoeae]|uniref:5' DNA nuclease n=1 Tax=Peteryoungia ipomoeae TaxID=1210932 RepID=A0A4V4HNC2_9HYPH|nr:5' DNA nuclease [Peteryoungia ipomoeae]THV25566.1 5' DNA nuclease [Peteryoungia ipomoeae]
MTGSSDKSGDGKSGKPTDETSASEDLDNLLNDPAAVMAAATAFGLSVATQMSRFWLGSLQGAMEVTGQLARQLEEERKANAAVRGSAEEAAKPVSEPKPQAAPTETPARSEQTGPAKSKAKVKAPAAQPKAAPKRSVTRPVAEPVATKKEATAKRAVASRMKKGSGQADDLKKIEGIGPKLEQVLRGRGISRFVDLMDLDDAALAALDTELGLDGRSLRDDWKGQAARLVKPGRKPR